MLYCITIINHKTHHKRKIDNLILKFEKIFLKIRKEELKLPKVKQYTGSNKILASNIAKYRTLTGLGTKDIAQALGYAESTVYPKLREKGMGNLKL